MISQASSIVASISTHRFYSRITVLNEYGSETVTLTNKQKVEKEVKEHNMWLFLLEKLNNDDGQD